MPLEDEFFRDDPVRRRFELAIQGGVVFADYRRGAGFIDLRHVETPAALRGQGGATRLMDAIAAWAREEGVKIKPTCPFAEGYFDRHPELEGLLFAA